MALIGKVEEFQENDYWREYTERLGHFTANEITDAGKKRAVLLSSCGAKTYKLIRNLVSPGKPTDKNLRWACKYCEESFKPAIVDYCLSLQI